VLADHHTGAIIAAPEFDPTYELCGGYGYCWPRDAAEAALALAEAGYPDYLIRLAQWLARVQLSSALWGQRYWTSGSVAASWSLRHDFLQLDQTASALIVICRALELLNDATPNHCLATAAAPEQDVLWRVTRSGANALLQSLGDDYCHKTACDLWETYPGVFAYTQAAIVAALGAARDCAVRHQDNDFAAELEHARVLAHQALMTFYVNGYFARGRIHGRLDPTVDSSTLGLVEPWRVLDLLHPVHRQMAVSTLSKIEDRLQYDLPEGRGIKRYEGDAYMSGAVGAVNTLWTALVCYRLALSAEHDGDARSWRDKADQYVRVALAHTTPTGLLPELIPLTPQYPYWAAPHAWASALLVRCALAAHQLGTRTLGRQDTVEASMPEALPPPTSQT
jgi:GH15 family glucan-1,4-alpha-glucosidase